MSLVIYNTMTGRKESFTPVEDGKAKIYVCGPTVYDHSHIGHGRAVVVFDVLYRHLQRLGFEVTYIRNFTDVDDKIIVRAREEGIGFLDLAEKHIRSFHEDMDALGVLRPDFEPRATEHIQEMIADIQSLVDRGHAYPVDGDVYYNVSSYPEYGRLSGRNIEDMRAGARIEVDDRKQNPLDFALWKESKPGEPSWPSPWGAGRPGWHIECSSMIEKYLGPEFDIHGGGHDLVFPHHENEIAQAAGLGRKFARYWMHNGFVRVNNEKMSKSLNNFFTIKEILAGYHPEIVRFFLLSKHYRSPIDYSEDGLLETKRGLDRAYRALQGAVDLGVKPAQDGQSPETNEITERFLTAMDDDINTARAIGCIFEGVKELNRLLDEARDGKTNIDSVKAWTSSIIHMGETLGILNQAPAEWFSRRAASTDADSDQRNDALSAEKIEALIIQRSEARSNKDWAEADRIRDELKAKGVVLEDVGGETRWRFE